MSQANWMIDPAHTQVSFTARHMMLMKVRGRFEKFEGAVNFDEANPAATTVAVKIAADTINTNEPKRDVHLRSADFFDAENFPFITFESTNVTMIDDHHARLTGSLTIRDVSRPVVLEVEYHGQARSPWGTTNAGFTAHTQIDRKDWGLTWNVALETGGWLVSDTIGIDLDVELIKQETAVPEAA